MTIKITESSLLTYFQGLGEERGLTGAIKGYGRTPSQQWFQHITG